MRLWRMYRHEDVLPVMCNCDHLAMGDQNPIARKYELVTRENGLWVSVRK